MTSTPLFEATALGNIPLSNRIVMAPPLQQNLNCQQRL
jgi:2,4-dienoyl-CoA reductase-like NADH-dependent reductase (Old Yellow Enzyme family)